ncbi:MobV family relaxase [Aliivibrio finisterrensis]|uniref:MobV family relaxase n=3 Tax=Aliivibrio finisterrensis TaxID=511998 RepID=UPI00101F2E97|nr:MobV family relaxase [Aliivibrio finisterrensis]RYU69630.1 hypothetical protein ERW48_18920 [Aliivibrio finisterrensis]
MTYRVSLRHARKKLHQLSQSDSHNYRREEYTRSNIDAERANSNRILHRMYDDESLTIKQMIERRIEEIPEKERPKIIEKGQNQTVIAVELVLSTSPEFFDDHPENFEKWVDLNVQHIKEKYKDNLLDIVLHLDEKTPHFHINVMPLEHIERNRRRTKKQIANNESAGTYSIYNFNAKKLFSVNELRKNQTEFAKVVEPLGIERGIKHSKAKHTTIKEYHTKIKNFLFNNTSKVNKKIEFKLEKPLTQKTLLSNNYERANVYYNRVHKQLKKFTSDVREYITCIEYALNDSRQKTALLSNTIDKLNKICDNDHELLSTRFSEMKQELDSLRQIEAKLDYQEKGNIELAKIIAVERSERVELEKELYRYQKPSKAAERAL